MPEIITEEGTRSSRMACKGAALHLARWMKTHPGSGSIPPEPEPEVWSTEQLRKRSKELRLLDVEQVCSKTSVGTQLTLEKSPSENDHSPSRSTNSDSQITVRSSPVVPETVAVCRQCHKRCFSKPSSPLINSSSAKSIAQNDKSNEITEDESIQVNHISCKLAKESERKPCTEKCSNISYDLESKLSISPEKKSALETMSEIRSAIMKSRESFFKNSPSKDSCTSPLNRTSPRSPSSQKSDSSHSTLYSTNSPLSYAHTTCSSIALSNSTGKKSLSPGRDSTASEGSSANEDTVQCVIAQEKYLNEVKCVENIILNKGSPFRNRIKDHNKIYMGKTIVERNSSASKNVNKNLVSELTKSKIETINIPNSDYFSNSTKTNGDLKKKENIASDLHKSPSEFAWGPLMLMGLSTMNPAAHLMQLDPQNRQTPPRTIPRTSPMSTVPNISVVPPTPDFKSESKNLLAHNTEDSPDDSPVAEEPPYLALKRYGTMSSLERIPSDEVDDQNLNNTSPPQEKETDTAQGLLGWTARAGSYVVEKMALLNSLAESGAASTGASFFERYLGAGEWRTVRGVVGMENDGNEGSGASGEEAWGTPSSGDLSDHAFPDLSDHATVSSPTKSSSSCPGDEDTELMMDELLMTPPITGPSLRPLLPRRRLEPLMEEEGSDASSSSSAEANSEITPSPTDQGSGAAGGAADPRPPAAAPPGSPPSPDRTPTNPLPPPGFPGPVSLMLLRESPDRGLDGRSTSSSTLEGCRSAPDGSEDSGSCGSVVAGEEVCAAAGGGGGELGGGRLSPRMEMRLALQEGTDILTEQEQRWDHVSGHCGWVRRPLGTQYRSHIPVRLQSTTLNSSASAPAGQVKVPTMERLAFLEARGARRGTRRPRPTARLMGLVRKRSSSDSPDRRPYSPRRQQPHDKQMDRRFWKQLRRRSSGNIMNIPT